MLVVVVVVGNEVFVTRLEKDYLIKNFFEFASQLLTEDSRGSQFLGVSLAIGLQSNIYLSF